MTPYYQDDLVTIYHGDATDVMAGLGSLSAIVTSPPYNLGGMSGGRANLAGGYRSYSDDLAPEIYANWQRAILTTCWGLLDDQGAIFYNHKPRIINGRLWTPLTLNPDLPLRQIIIWVRPSGVNQGDAFFAPRQEWILLFAKPGFGFDRRTSSLSDVWEFNHSSGHDRPDHPAPFPVGLPMRAIGVCPPSELPILDPFMGSGTTLVAAKSLNRHAIGIEIEERYCEIAANRCRQEVLGLAL